MKEHQHNWWPIGFTYSTGGNKKTGKENWVVFVCLEETCRAKEANLVEDLE